MANVILDTVNNVVLDGDNVVLRLDQLNPDPQAQSTAIDQAAIVQVKHVFAVDALDQSQTIDNGTLVQANVLVPDNHLQIKSIDNVTLALESIELIVQPHFQIQGIESLGGGPRVIINQANILEVNPLNQTPSVFKSAQPIIAIQDNLQTTTELTPQDANCETTPLENGVDYIVFYTGSNGISGNTNLDMQMLLVHGSDILSLTKGRGGINNPADTFANGQMCAGFRFVTGNGVDTVKFQHNMLPTGNPGTSRAGAMSIAAFDVRAFGSETFSFGSNSEVRELDGVDDTFQISRKENFDFDSEEYLVFFSTENGVDTGTLNVDSAQTRFLIDGNVVTGNDFYRKGTETGTPTQNCYFVFSVIDPPAGVAAVEIQHSNLSANPLVHALRSNFFAVKRNFFEQLKFPISNTGLDVTNSTFDGSSIVNTDTFVPISNQNVFVLSYTISSHSTVLRGATHRLIETDDSGAIYQNDAGHVEGIGASTTESDQYPVTLFAVHASVPAVIQRWKHELRSNPSRGDINRSPDNLTSRNAQLVIGGLPGGITVGQRIEEAFLKPSLLPDDMLSVMTYQQAFFGEIDPVEVDELTQNQFIDEPKFAQDNIFFTDDVNQTQTIDEPVFQQGGSLQVDFSLQTQAIDNLELAQKSVLTSQELSQSQAIDEAPQQAPHDEFFPDAQLQTQAIDSVVFTLVQIAAPLFQSQAIDNTAFKQSSVITIDELSQNQSIAKAMMVESGVFGPDNSQQFQDIQEVSINVRFELDVDASSQSQSIDEPTITQASVFAVDELLNAQQIDNIDLLQASVLSADAALQSQTIDNLVLLFTSPLVTVDNSDQSQQIDIANFTQAHVIDPLRPFQFQLIDQAVLYDPSQQDPVIASDQSIIVRIETTHVIVQ